MPQSDSSESDVATLPGEQTESQNTPRTRRQPPYAVVLHNDDMNTFDFVIGVLMKVFRYPLVRAFRLTLQAHHKGRSIVWSGALEVAELKADQIKSCGADPACRSKGAQPLRVTVEPLPSE